MDTFCVIAIKDGIRYSTDCNCSGYRGFKAGIEHATKYLLEELTKFIRSEYERLYNQQRRT